MTFKLFTLAAAAALVTTLAHAEGMTPGAHFIENWDMDGDGAVSPAEAAEKRDLVFAAFDGDEDGVLSDAEYALFDEARALDMASMREEMGEMGEGKGMGKGKGEGKGHGMGQGMGQGGHGPNEDSGMARAFNDVDGDGRVTKEEFLARTPDFFAMMDGDGDGAITTADFGRG